METFLRRLTWILAVGTAAAACANADLETGLKDRYQLQRASVNEDGQGRAAGQFNLRGDLTEPVAARSNSLLAGGASPSAESLARAFAVSNRRLFGIVDTERDLQLASNRRDASGNHHLRFHRLVNGLRLEGMELLFHVNSEGDVSGVNGNIVRVSPELRQHLEDYPQLPRQKEEKIRAAIAADLGVSTTGFAIKDLQLMAVNQAPFIVWQLDVQLKRSIGHFRYRISDTDVRILHKRDLVHMKFGKQHR